MIIQTRDNKDLIIPKSLGNFVINEGGTGGVTPEEAAEIASAVTEVAIDEYDTELQVELEDIRDAVSGNTDAISALSGATSGMSADIAALSGETETQAAAISNLEDYTQNELAPAIGGIAEGLEALSGVTSGMSADIAAVSGQTSANTENIASLSAATEAISESLGNYATTADTNELATAISGVSESLANYATTAVTNEISTAVSGITDSLNHYATTATTDALSAVTSALTENLETLSGGTPTIYSAGTAYTWCVIYDYDTINSLSNAQKSEVFSEIKSYGGQGKFTYIRKLGANGRNQFFPQSQLTATKAEYFSLGGANYDYVSLTSAGALSNGYLAIYTLPTAAANKKGGVKVGSGLTMNGEVMSVNIGEGLAYSGNSIVVSGGTGGGKETIIINNLDSAGLASLATRLFGYYDSENNVIDYPVDELELYWWLPDPNYVGGYDDNGYKDYVKVMPVNVEGTEWSQNGMWLSGPFSLGSFDGGNLLRNFRIMILEDGSLVGAGVDAVPVPQEISYSWVRFGNDERGELTYDADNDCFYYDNNTIATGDTTNVYEDLIDNLMTDSMFEGGLIFGTIYPVNYFRLYVTENGETKVYTHPVLSKKTFETPVTIDSQDYYKEVTYNYGDWKFTAYYGANDGNNAANLRMARV